MGLSRSVSTFRSLRSLIHSSRQLPLTVCIPHALLPPDCPRRTDNALHNTGLSQPIALLFACSGTVSRSLLLPIKPRRSSCNPAASCLHHSSLSSFPPMSPLPHSTYVRRRSASCCCTSLTARYFSCLSAVPLHKCDPYLAGIVGQGFDGIRIDGRMDNYVPDSRMVFTTTAQGQGCIEGKVGD